MVKHGPHYVLLEVVASYLQRCAPITRVSFVLYLIEQAHVDMTALELRYGRSERLRQRREWKP